MERLKYLKKMKVSKGRIKEIDSLLSFTDYLLLFPSLSFVIFNKLTQSTNNTHHFHFE